MVNLHRNGWSNWIGKWWSIRPFFPDFGYWTSFEYGKWSDGYGWRSPKVNGKQYQNKYTYCFGVKEIYYLDKIKTRTHTALFLKSIRQDDKSTLLEYGAKDNNGQLLTYPGGPMARNLTEQYQDRITRPIDQGGYYNDYNNNYNYLNINYDYDYKHSSYKYLKVPINQSLKLDKIVLLKEEDALNIDKSLSTPARVLNRKVGYVYFDYGFFGAYSWLRKNPYGVRECNINTDQNVLETQDIIDSNNTQIYSKAIKTINFKQDYSLGNSLPNSSSGRLALKELEFSGRNNSNVMPPFKFEYNDYSQSYNFTNSDNWGYVKQNVDAWSLSKIITPLGGFMKINYEEDSFSHEVIKQDDSYRSFQHNFVTSMEFNKIQSYQIIDNDLKLNFNQSLVNDNLTNLFQINSKITLNYTYLERFQYEVKKMYKKMDYRLISVDNANKSVVLKLIDNVDLTFQNDFYNYPPSINQPVTIGNRTKSNIELCSYGLNNIFVYGANGRLGGGLRVKKIEVFDGVSINSNSTIEYDYFNPYTNITSGTTTYEPTSNLEQDSSYRGVQELPSPDVIYEYVTVLNKSNTDQILSKSRYQFNTLNQLFINNVSYYSNGTTTTDGNYLNSEDFYSMNVYSKKGLNNIFASKIVIKDNLSSVGRIKRIDQFNSANHTLKSIIYKYKGISDYENDYGINQETFNYYRRGNRYQQTINADGYYEPISQKPYYFFNSISKINLPNELVSVTTLSDGFTNTINYDKHDFLTGQVLETTSTSSDGKSFKTKIVPAYTKYAPMGSKVDNLDNKNMLSQTAAEYSFILDGAIWKETGVGITTWNNEWNYQDIGGTVTSPSIDKEKIWRKYKTFIWNGDKDSQGIFSNFNSATDDDFVWGVGLPQTNIKWKQTSEIKLYDKFSMPLEVVDINSNKASTKMDVLHQKIEANGNAAYNELYYSGAEVANENDFYVGQEVRNTNGIRTQNKFHTGKYSIAATNNSQFGVYMRNGHRAGRYKLSVWIHKDNVSKAKVRASHGSPDDFNGETYYAGNWVLKTHYFNVTVGDFYPYVTSSDATTVYFDDLMIRPIASTINGYVYNEFDELTYIIGNNGLATKFEYDEAGRLIKTYSEIVDDSANGITGGFKLKSTHKINYRTLN